VLRSVIILAASASALEPKACSALAAMRGGSNIRRQT